MCAWTYENVDHVIKTLRPHLTFFLSFFLPRRHTDNHRRGMYLQIAADGTVSGSDLQTLYSE